MIWSVKQACTRNLSTYIHNRTDPDLCAGAYTHGTVDKGGPCKCTRRHLIFKSLQDLLKPGGTGRSREKDDCRGRTCCLQFPSSWCSLVSGSGRWDWLSRTDIMRWTAHLRKGWEPLLSVTPFLGKSKANTSLSTVPKNQLQSGAMMTSALLLQLFNPCLSDQQRTSKDD